MLAFDVGGGITARGPAFLQELRAELRHGLRPDFHRLCDIALASAGNPSGLLGAARLWPTRHGGAVTSASNDRPPCKC